MKLVLIAVVIAIPAAWYFTDKWLQEFAYQINMEWWIFVAASVIALIIALMTVSVQAIKAAVQNPVNSLRMESEINYQKGWVLIKVYRNPC